jgi:hypothetical protein
MGNLQFHYKQGRVSFPISDAGTIHKAADNETKKIPTRNDVGNSTKVGHTERRLRALFSDELSESRK